MLRQPPTCEGCPLYGVGQGFVLGSGDPKTAKVALMLEAPGREELLYAVSDAELERRRKRFPYLDDVWLRRGQPVVGKAGATLWQWGLAPVQITPHSSFVDNGLRCLPPKSGNAAYPTGDTRKRAEAWCRQYDRWDEYDPTVCLVNIHPAAISRDVTPLPLQVRTFEKAKDFANGGEKPLVLCGGKAVHLWLGYASNVTRWVGHYQRETEALKTMRESRRVKDRELVIKTKGPKKLTAKAALTMLLGKGVAWDTNGSQGMDFNFTLTKAEFDEMMAATVTAKKEKKT